MTSCQKYLRLLPSSPTDASYKLNPIHMLLPLTVCCCALQDILTAVRQSLLPGSTGAPAAQQQQQQQELADALEGYNGGPAFLLTEVRSEADPPSNVAGPAGALVYGLSVAVCLSSGLAEEGGAGLGTVGLNEVRAGKLMFEPTQILGVC